MAAGLIAAAAATAHAETESDGEPLTPRSAAEAALHANADLQANMDKLHTYLGV